MSFSSEIKQQLEENEIKKDCCKENFENGKNLGEFIPKCDKDFAVYLRGAFLKHGSISSPGRNFMLCFLLPNDEKADYVAKVLEEAGIPPHRSVRKNKPLLYYKAAESIEDLLGIIGGTKAMLQIMQEKAVVDLRNKTNRLCNAETANLDRIAKAAAEQREAILILEKYGVIENLPKELKECAQLRLANPDIGLAQLSRMVSEPVSKSGLNHRFKRLIEMAQAYKNH